MSDVVVMVVGENEDEEDDIGRMVKEDEFTCWNR